MASPLTEAVISSMTYNLNPENRSVAEFMGATTQKLELEVNDLKLDQLSRIRKLIAEAKDADASVSVLDAYERMLVKLTS